MRTALLLVAFTLTAHTVNAQPQYCTITMNGVFTSGSGNLAANSAIYNNRVNQCANWNVTVSFPSQVTSPQLTLMGSWDSAGSPGSFAPFPPSCISGGFMATMQSGAFVTQTISNPMVFAHSGGWGNIVVTNCYFPFVEIMLRVSSVSQGSFTAPARASGSSGVTASTAIPSTGGTQGPGNGGSNYAGPTASTTAAPWFGSPTGSRTSGAVYQNATGKPIWVTFSNTNSSSLDQIYSAYCSTDSGANGQVAQIGTSDPTNYHYMSMSFVVPPGYFYRITGAPGFSGFIWTEVN